MSVIDFEQQRINKFLGMARFHHQAIVRQIKNSPCFSHYYLWTMRLNMKLSEEQVAEHFIERMFTFAFIANHIAYGLQYQQAVNFTDIQANYKEADEIACSKKQLFKEISSLIYNLKTNDGDMFLEHKWYEPLNHLYKSLAVTEMYP